VYSPAAVFLRVTRVGAKGFASSRFHPRFFHRVTSAREIHGPPLSAQERQRRREATASRSMTCRTSSSGRYEVLNINLTSLDCIRIATFASRRTVLYRVLLSRRASMNLLVHVKQYFMHVFIITCIRDCIKLR